MMRRFSITNSQPLLEYLLDALETKRTAVKKLLKFGAVQVNGAAIRDFNHPLEPGDEVTVGTLHATAARSQLHQARIEIVYEDDWLIVVNKPAGLLTVSTDRRHADTLHARLTTALGGGQSKPTQAVVVHRLDRDTSGLIIFAKDHPTKLQLQSEWASVKKLYLAVVHGRPFIEQSTISNYLSEDSKTLYVRANDRPRPGARLATTHYRVVRTCNEVSLLEVQLQTGRKHQIRVHLADLGYPVVGDRRYGKKSSAAHRLALHASGLQFAHPVSGQQLHLTSPLPPALFKLLKRE